MSHFSRTKFFGGMPRGSIEIVFFRSSASIYWGGEAILGKSVKEVLPKSVGYTVQKALGLTLRRGVPQDVQCVLPAGKQCYVASVRLFPYDSEVLGFVTDHDLTGKPVIHVTPDHPSMEFLSYPLGILPQTTSSGLNIST